MTPITTKQLDLRQTPTWVAGLASETQRLAHMEQLLNQLGLNAQLAKGLNAPDEGYQGCALSHLRALSRCDSAQPVLVLENDCQTTANYTPTIEYPADADIVYLGASSCGFVADLNDRGIPGAAIALDISDDYLRVYNMAATHAILYTSARAIEMAKSVIVQYMVDGRPHDIGYQALQRQLNTYVLRQPMFYQYGALQNRNKAVEIEQHTNIQFGIGGPPQTLNLNMRISGQIDMALQQDAEGLPYWKVTRQVANS
ncbi:MAG: hypothetical protein V7711_01205 [Pseudomonadales bacterium]